MKTELLDCVIVFCRCSSTAMNLPFLSLQLDEMLGKQGLKVDKVLNFAIDDAILEERITGRWIHPSSGRTYHTKFAPPKAPGVDDVSLHLYFKPCQMLVA